MMSPVISAPAPEATVRAINTTVSQSQIDFNNSTDIERNLDHLFIYTVAIVGALALVGAAIAAAFGYKQIVSYKKGTS
jgi:hypothetical protein